MRPAGCATSRRSARGRAGSSRTAWCGPCRTIAPTIEMLARELAGRVLVGKLDVDANTRTAAKFGVQGIPTLLILKNGREVDRLVGVQTREQILRKLNPHI